MSITQQKYTIQPILFGLLFKVVLSKKISNGYYEDWSHYTQSLHFTLQAAKLMKEQLEEK